ncbi:MAG: redoxin domain-containing protein, partial [Anaerolineaceae bacterium]|nr:redoxin domain-containing protein [Anaerolineaceae bacterium]
MIDFALENMLTILQTAGKYKKHWVGSAGYRRIKGTSQAWGKKDGGFMRMNMWKILAVVAVLALTSLSCAAAGPGARVGSEAPDFTLTSSAGKEIRLGAFRGRPVVLNFFTTWCGPCRDEMPGMQKMFEAYFPQGLVLIAVDLGDTPADVKKYALEMGLGFPLLLDQESRVGDQYGVNSFPRTFFIDTEGIIRKISIGSMEEAEIAAGIEDLLQQAREAKEKMKASGSGKGVEGCVNINAAIARIGPGKKFHSGLKLNHEECFAFDARSEDGKWLRMADMLSY